MKEGRVCLKSQVGFAIVQLCFMRHNPNNTNFNDFDRLWKGREKM